MLKRWGRGFVSGLAGLPTVLVDFPAVTIVDPWEPRRLIVLSDAVRTVSLTSFARARRFGHLSLPQICAAM